MHVLRGFLISAVFAFRFAAQTPEVYFSVPGVDAPELAHRGAYHVGVRTVHLVNPGQVDILNFDKATGKAPLYDRPLDVEIWYPATIPDSAVERTVYESAMPGSNGRLQILGKALRDAAPVTGQKFPLVIVSHGYPGSRTFLTYLTENLASKGYIVAAIDHTDSVFGAVKGFQSTLLNRSMDQLFTIDALTAQPTKKDDFLNGILDAGNVAIVGYSMGGYGALASAGAAYRKDGMAAGFVPGGYFANANTTRSHPNLKAVVAMAPWGMQPPFSSWDEAGLAGTHIPSLFIVGDQDDVSEYQTGVKRAFDGAVNSDRCMLVYENARHNVGGNPPPPGVPLNFEALQSFDEPVWRKDRITAINQHFVTAFLDLYLKGDETRRPYLHVGMQKSNDGKWPLAQGQSAGAAFSKGSEKEGQTVWRGFQRRWAVGLEMYCADRAAKVAAVNPP